MKKIITKLKIELGIPVKMTGREFMSYNEKMFIKNKNKKQQIAFLKDHKCYDTEGVFVLDSGGVAIVNEPTT